MAFLTDEQELSRLRTDSESEAKIWQHSYAEFQRLADNEIIEDLDEILPRTNDGSLSAALFKLPKRIVNTDLTGRAKAVDSDEAWVTELANITWETKIIPNANTQAPFHRKWKDAVRKAAIYGHVPLITVFVERGSYVGADFIVAQPGDVLLEPGKVSDSDSDVFFWDTFYSKLKLENLIERAKAEEKEAKDNKETDEEAFNKWNVAELEAILKDYNESEKTDPNNRDGEKPKQKGEKFSVVYQRGVNAPFYMVHTSTKKIVREWTNPDPSGDVPVHFLYCYQDMENPYGVGIAKLAGGTQNVLDYMRQADVHATMLGLRPPISVSGINLQGYDPNSIVWSQDAIWELGNAVIKRETPATEMYAQLPERISMYQASLQKIIPMGDTSISGTSSGDANFSKTPAGVKFQAASLSIDDDDFKDNLYQTYEVKARSMINTHFANMQGSDLMKLSDENREILQQSGLQFPLDAEGNPTNELEVIWDNARAEFTYEIDAEQDKSKDEDKRLEGLLRVAEFRASDPNFDAKLQMSGKRINDGELFSSIIQLTTDNDKILEDITPEDQEAIEQEAMIQEAQQGMPQEMPEEAMPQQGDEQYIEQIMQQFQVPEYIARGMAEAEAQGHSPEDIMQVAQMKMQEDANV